MFKSRPELLLAGSLILFSVVPSSNSPAATLVKKPTGSPPTSWDF